MQYQDGEPVLLSAIEKQGIEALSFPDFMSKALQFCLDWKHGQKEFELFTSGSTGKPKRLSVTRRQMESSARQTINALSLKRRDTALVCLNPEYVAGVMMLVRSLEAGMNIVFVSPSSNPFEGLSTPVDFAALVPMQAETILRSADREKLNRQKAVIIGGAPVSFALEEAIQGISSPVFATYGMTETLSHIALKRLNGSGRSPYFEVLGNTRIRTDERGCLAVCSAVTCSQWIQTNDIVERAGEDRFIWKGRADFVINSGGVKVHPEEVEARVQEEAGLRGWKIRFAVVGLPDESLGEKTVLLVEDISFTEKKFRELLDLLSKRLNRYKLPKEFYVFSEFPETPTGKLKRRELKERLLKGKMQG